MWFSYLIATIPLVLGGVVFVKNENKIKIYEWLGFSLLSLLSAFIFNYIVVMGMTTDYETWSGEITKAYHHPFWVESYQEAVYRTETTTDSKGNASSTSVFDHYETRYRDHPEYWDCETSTGNNQNIDPQFYEQICHNFGIKLSEYEYKSGFYSGDNNIYYTTNKNNYCYPTTTWRRFENKIIASPNLFSYEKVPKNIPAYEYPKNDNWLVSNRLINCNRISSLDWDRLNARLGSSKKVNLILINFGNQDSSIAHFQESKWVGGKKNDLVLCYGEGWSYVFGWTEKDLVKRNLETILLKNKIDQTIIPLIENEVIENYEIKKWKKFNYLSVSLPWWSYFILIAFLGISQGLIYYFLLKNRNGYDYNRNFMGNYDFSTIRSGQRSFGSMRKR